MKISSKMKDLGTEGAFEVLAKARALEAGGQSVIHLEIGEPDFDTPAHIIEAGVQALRSGFTHYSPTAGIPELRSAIASYIGRTRGIPVDPERVIVGPGAKPILFSAIVAMVEPGDEVIYPDPSYPIYRSVIEFAGALPVALPLLEERDFTFDVAELKKLVTPRTRLIILNSPHNPTGGMLAKADLEAIADIASSRDVGVLADEIYSRIIYEGEHHSVASLGDMASRTVIMDGFSKTYAMTGWRLGYAVVPEVLIRPMTRLLVNTVSCTATFVQRAGVAALEGDQAPVDAMVAEFRRRRDYLVKCLGEIPGISCRVPRGAFYVFPNVKRLGSSSEAIADHLLKTAAVATLSGVGFGDHGEGYLRLSYANSLENLQEAVRRIAQGVVVLAPPVAPAIRS